MSTAQQIRAAILGLVVEDIIVSQAGKRRLARVLVEADLAALDLADGTSVVEPVSLDAVAEATRAIGDALDASDVMGSSAYVLEVSSPGTSRPLTTWDHFRRNVGRLVEVHHDEAVTTGRVVDVDPATVTLEVPADKKRPAQRLSIPLSDAVRGLVQVEFKHAPAAGTADEVADTAADDPSDVEEED